MAGRTARWMSRGLRAPRVTLALAGALALSLGAHAVRGPGGEPRAPAVAHVVALERQGPDEQPLLLLDFDSAMAPPAAVGAAEGPVGLRLEPAAALQGRWLTSRRLALRPLAPLPPFRAWSLVLPSDLAALDGRPVVADMDLAFRSGRYGLAQPPRPVVDADGAALLRVTLKAPARGAAPLAGARVLDAAGAALPLRWTRTEGAGPADWTGRLEAPAPRGATVLELPAGLAPAGGGDPLSEAERHALAWSTTLRLTGTWVRANGELRTVVLDLSHAVAEQDLAAFLEVRPAPADLRLSSDGDELRLTGSFAPGTEVLVRVRRGLRARGGLTLEQDAQSRVPIPRPEAEVRIAAEGRTLSTAAVPELVLAGVNVPRVRVTLRPVYANNLVPVALGWACPCDAAARGVTREIAIDAAPDVRFRHVLDLALLLGERPRGPWWVRVEDPEHPWLADARLLQLSDLAPVVRLRPEGALVWVLRTATGRPQPGAAVRALSRANQPVAEGLTDEQGLVVLRGPFAEEPFLVTAALEGDTAWVDLDSHALAHAARDVEGLEPVDGIEAAVLPASGVVRPGDILAASVLLRTPAGAAPPEGFPVRLVLEGPDGRELSRQEQRCAQHGLLAVDLPFALDAPTGPRTLKAQSADGSTLFGRAGFRVEAVLPDRLEPRVSLPDGALVLGREVSVGLSARLLTGEPAALRRARLRLAGRAAPVRVEDGFTYGDAVEAPAAFERTLGELTLDADGRGALTVVLPAPNAAGRALDLDFVLEVTDVSGRAAFARASARAASTGPALGLALPADEGGGVRVRVEGLPAGSVEGVVERVRWGGSYVRRGQQLRWQAQRTAEVVARQQLTLVEGAATLTLPALADGEHVVRVRAPGAQPAALAFERWDGRLVAAQESCGAPRLPLRLLAPEPAPGSRAEVAVEAPFAGEGLLTVEGPGVLEARRVAVAAGTQRFEVQVPDVPAPNVHVTLTLVRAQAQAGDGPVRLVGAVRLPVHRAERQLGLGLTAPAQALPESPLRLTLSTSEPCEVRVHVVDEGLLRLTSHPVPDPAAMFAAPRKLATRLGDAYTQLLAGARFPSEAGEPGGDRATDAALAARLDPAARRTIETLALASARLLVDGLAEVVLPLPDFEGRVRVVVLAASARGTGSASAQVVVRGPIGLSVHVPRAVAPGDEFLVPVEVRGEGVTTVAEAEGLEVLATAPVLRLRARPATGPAAVTVTATDASGSVVRRRATLSVRPAAPLEVRHQVERLTAAGRLGGRLPDGLLASTRRARLTAGGRASAALLPALERLLEYPYGCVEQTTSQAFPLLAWSDLARLAAGEGGAPGDTVSAAIERLLSMQTADGGLACWPGGEPSYPYGSAYAAHFLVEARISGRAPAPEALARLLSYLERGLSEGAQSAYAAYVLTRAGRAPSAWLERLADAAPTHEERAWLAAAFVLRGEAVRAAALLEPAEDPERVAREDGGSLASPVRAAATLLTALLAARPDDARIPALADGLRARAAAAQRLTTQENAAALLALARYEQSRRSRDAGARGTLTAGGRTLRFDAEHAAVLELGPGDDPDWTLEADGPVTLLVRVEGVPEQPESDRAAPGYQVSRRIEGDPAVLRSGEVYTLVLAGRVPEGTENVLLCDVLPGGLEAEDARGAEGSFAPDRIEPRDDRVLFFRSAALSGAFELRYRVRAVAPGRFAWPAAALEALYMPGEGASAGSGGRLEVQPADGSAAGPAQGSASQGADAR